MVSTTQAFSACLHLLAFIALRGWHGEGSGAVVPVYCPVTLTFFNDLSPTLDCIVGYNASLCVVGDLNVRLDRDDDPVSQRCSPYTASSSASASRPTTKILLHQCANYMPFGICSPLINDIIASCLEQRSFSVHLFIPICSLLPTANAA